MKDIWENGYIRKNGNAKGAYFILKPLPLFKVAICVFESSATSSPES